ncbi:MAG: tetratricopeptide repeat protein [Candidatus Pacebacteria bacterium]|nr:tetratricopeptide repeat protein [Candidatus Paceibacterota bacterium]
MNPEQTAAAVPESQSVQSRIESWSSGILIALAFILPVVFLPIAYLQQNAVKGYLIIFAVLASAILYGVSRIKARSFEWIAHPLSYIGIVFALVLLVSSIASGDFLKSFFGEGFEYSAAFLMILCISAWLMALFSSRSPSRALSVYAAILGGFVLLAVFQIVKLIDPAGLSFGLFSGATSTPVGSWYDLGIYSGAVFILLSIAFLYFPMGKAVKYTVGAVFAVSAFLLVLIGIPTIWFGIALVFLALVFQRLFNEKKGQPFAKRLPIFAFVVFVIAAFMSWNGGLITAPLANALKVGYYEVHLPWQMTLDVGTGIIKASPLLGSGPNTFAKEYLLYKPLAINPTQFWSTQFTNGSGLIPTLALSLGLAGIIIFCLLCVYFIRDGVRALRKAGHLSAGGANVLLPYVSYSSFFAGAFLLFMDIAYAPSYTEFFLTFVFIGIFIGTRVSSGSARLAVVPFGWKAMPAGRQGRSPAYARSICLVVLLVLAAAFVLYGMKAVALGYFTKGAASISSSPLSSAELANAGSDFKKALSLDPSDTYDQALAETDLAGVNAVVSQISSAGSNAKPTAAQIQQVSSLINDATLHAAAAVKRDPSNYYNYLSEARVFSTAASIQVSGAYAAAITAYTNATKDDPYDPSLYLSMAQLAANQSKYDDATSYLGSALQLKNNYTDAVYLLSQIQVAQGKTADAITSVTFATQLNPTDPTAFFELGLLQYNAAQYSSAVTSLAKAVTLSPNYANAQYFLGLSYARTGDMPDAISQFQSLAKTNPDNSDVASILANLTAGKQPFVDQKPPVSTPEKRNTLPVNDSATAPSSGKAAAGAQTPSVTGSPTE